MREVLCRPLSSSSTSPHAWCFDASGQCSRRAEQLAQPAHNLEPQRELDLEETGVLEGGWHRRTPAGFDASGHRRPVHQSAQLELDELRSTVLAFDAHDAAW